MKKLVAIILCVVLAAMLVVPAAFAGEGQSQGKGKESAPGQQKKAEDAEDEAAAKKEAKDKGSKAEESEEVTGDAEGKGKAKGKSEDKGKNQGAEKGKGSEDASGTPKRSKEESGTTERKRTGIENAFDRISANIAKAEQKVADGTKKQVPPGLLNVYEKFLGWLGLADAVEGGEADGDGSGSGESTQTPEPDEGDIGEETLAE